MTPRGPFVCRKGVYEEVYKEHYFKMMNFTYQVRLKNQYEVTKFQIFHFQNISTFTPNTRVKKIQY